MCIGACEITGGTAGLDASGIAGSGAGAEVTTGSGAGAGAMTGSDTGGGGAGVAGGFFSPR